VTTGSSNLNTLPEIEAAMVTLRTGAGSTPFILDMPVPPGLQQAAEKSLKSYSIFMILDKFPTLGVWGILLPLSRNYAEDGKGVYRHITSFLGRVGDDQQDIERLKSRYRQAARRIGLPIPTSNQPTGLFFAAMGPARAQLGILANALVWMALHHGPPATEDTASARAWQRRAVTIRCPNHTRIQATVRFDQSAHIAQRFDHWRRGEAANGKREGLLFDAYDRAIASFHRKRSDIVAPPKVLWSGAELAVEPEPSRHGQSLTLGAFPTPVAAGSITRIPAPWPEKLSWRCRNQSQDIHLAPQPGVILLFDADSGALLSRERQDARTKTVSAERLVILSRNPFSSPSFGAAIPAEDPHFRVAWAVNGEALEFEDGQNLEISAPEEASIWLDARSLASDGSRRLFSCEGAVVVKLDAEIGGRSRILRATLGNMRRFREITVNSDGIARVPFADLGLAIADAPQKIRFDVLAPGAAGDAAARAELSAAAWIWPGVARIDGDPAVLPRPANYLPAHSAGLRETPGGLVVDDRADVEIPILGVSSNGEIREFGLRLDREGLWHYHVPTQTRARVPRGKTLIFGHSSLHDTLTVRSTDRHADILALGAEIRGPFIGRMSWEIGASLLEEATGDDRIALRRKDGRIDLLARIRHVDDPRNIDLTMEDDRLDLSLDHRGEIDAIRIDIRRADGASMVADHSLGRRPVPLPALQGLSVRHDPTEQRLAISLPMDPAAAPGRMRLLYRATNEETFQPFKDSDGADIALGLPGEIGQIDIACLKNLAGFLGQKSPSALGDQVKSALQPAYEQAIREISPSRMVGPIKAALLDMPDIDECAPRHDLAGSAPWIFEASGAAFSGISAGSGLAPLAQLARHPRVPGLPDPRGDDPMQAWLARLATDVDLPPDFASGRLEAAFHALRFRTRDTDLHDLVTDDLLSATVRLVTDAHVDTLGHLRSFDAGGGGDPRPARIAASIERFARAAALGEAERHVDGLVTRTGLPRAEIGQALTLMLRAGIEFFVYFRGLWSQAAQQHERPT